jgi:hypothetical protein
MAGSDTAVSLAEIIDCAFYLLGRSIVEHMTKAKQNEKIAIPEFACKPRRLMLNRDDAITSSGNDNDGEVKRSVSVFKRRQQA